MENFTIRTQTSAPMVKLSYGQPLMGTKASRDEILPLHAAESMLRLLEMRRLAEDTFGSSQEADAWMRRPHPMLEGEAPLECAKSAFGAQRVKDMLMALKYGGIA